MPLSARRQPASVEDPSMEVSMSSRPVNVFVLSGFSVLVGLAVGGCPEAGPEAAAPDSVAEVAPADGAEDVPQPGAEVGEVDDGFEGQDEGAVTEEVAAGEDAADSETAMDDAAPVGDADGEDADEGCIPNCGIRECGEDGCGGECGPCGGDEVCSRFDQCVEREGVCGDGVIDPDETCDPGPDRVEVGCTAECQVFFGFTCEGEPSVCRPRDLEEDGTLCSRPIQLEGRKFYARLSVAGQFNTYHPFSGACTGEEGFSTSSFGPDLTFAIDVEAGQTVVVQMRSNVMPVTLALSTACGEEDPTDYVLNEACVAIVQERTLGTWAEIRWPSPETQTVFIVTGTPRSMDSGPFELAISLK